MGAIELDDDSTLEGILAEHAGMDGPLLPILHAVQDAVGYISAAHVARIAQALNLSRAEVHGVVSFYHYFRQHEPGRHVVHVCRAEACQAMHCERTEQRARQELGVDYGGTSADGLFTLEAAYCLGNCAAAPSVMIDEKLYGRVTPERLEAILADWRNRG
jgi:formate dehydrogenase subunit gamma